MTHSIISLGQRAAPSALLLRANCPERTARPAFSVGQNDQLILLRVESGCHLGNLIFNDIEALRKNNVVNLTTLFSGNWEINVLPFSLHGFPAPFRRRFPALPCGVIAVYPMQTVMRLSRCGAGFGNKKSPHNNLNLTIPSGMALVRVCYVAIRKLKTCSGSFGSRAGTLSKYVILNCWNRLPQKSSHVNVNLSGRGPSILLRKTVLSLKSPTGAFIAALRFANANF